MKIPFSPPDITEEEVEQVAEALRSGKRSCRVLWGESCSMFELSDSMRRNDTKIVRNQ